MNTAAAAASVLAFGCPAIAQFDGFGPPQSLTGTDAVISAALLDLNRDGALDLVATRFTDATFDSVIYWLNNGDGTFGPAATRGVGGSPTAVAVGDIDSDGDVDAIVANRDSDDISVLRSTGNGAFLPEFVLTSGDRPQGVALADFNRDGALDIVVSNENDSTVTVFTNNGPGVFGFSSATFSTNGGSDFGLGPRAVVAVDLNKDGFPDIATANSDSDTVSVLYSTGAGGFFTGDFALFVAAGIAPLDLKTADLNRDGFLDLVVAASGTDEIRVLTSDANLPFPNFTSASFASGDRPVRLGIADLNRDGALDVVSANELSNTFTVFLGDGAGSLTRFSDTTSGDSPKTPSLGDLDGDGDIDLALPLFFSDRVDIYLSVENVIPNCTGDLTGDGVVNAADLASLLGSWGACP